MDTPNQVGRSNRQRAFNRALAVFLITLGSAVRMALADPAPSFVVNTTADTVDPNDGVLSLREAITLANAAGTPATITFDATVFNPANAASTIQLGSALPDLANDITITGPGANVLTVAGQGTTAASYRLMRITSGHTVSVSGLAFSGGLVQGAAGRDGDGTYQNPATAGSPGFGGAIYNSGALALSACLFTQNTALGGMGGSEPRSNLSGQQGGGGLGGAVYSDGVSLSVDRCTFSQNDATGGNGGNANFFSQNPGSGGNAGPGYGGALYVAGGTLQVTSSTFAANVGAGGVGGDTSYGGGWGGNAEGAAIYSTQPCTIYSCTIVQNAIQPGHVTEGHGAQNGLAAGGGIFGVATVTIGNTLIAANTASNPATPGVLVENDIAGPFSSAGFNLVAVADSSSFPSPAATDQLGTASAPIDAKLDPAGAVNHGGTLATVRLLRNSPAVDKGRDLLAAGTDEIGNPRPTDLDNSIYPNAAGGDGSDIGAYEAASVGDDAPVAMDGAFLLVIGLPHPNVAATATDVNHDALFFSLAAGSTAPAGLTFQPDGTITGNPLQPGVYVLKFTATDGFLESNVATLTLVVSRSFNLTINSDQDGAVSAGNAITLRAAAELAYRIGITTPVTFDATVFATAKTITLDPTLGPIQPGGAVEIDGPGAGLTISGGDQVAILRGGGITLKNLTLVHGVPAIQATTGGVNLIGCTLSSNQADGSGGAISVQGSSVTLNNCTVAQNSAPGGDGGAIYVSSGSITLNSSTVALNTAAGSGGGVKIVGGSANFEDALVASNTDGAGQPDVSGTVSSKGYNLIGSSAGLTFTGTTTGNLVDVNPGLSPAGLTNNGGITQTIAITPSSPAVNHGIVSLAGKTDQRGQTRPVLYPGVANATGGDGTDIGAYELINDGPVINVQKPAGTSLASGSTINFGTVTQGQSASVTVTIANMGLANLVLTQSESGANPGDFGIDILPGATIAPQSSSTFAISFAPSSSGPESATLTIASNDSIDGAFTLTLTGISNDVATLPPILTAPASQSVTRSPVSVSYTLREAAAPGTVNLTVLAGATNVYSTMLSGSSFESAGVHSFSLDATGLGIPNGTYSFVLAYQDLSGHPAALAANTGVTLYSQAPVITGTFSPLTVVQGAALADYAAQASTEAGLTITQSIPAGTILNTVGEVDVTLSATDAGGNTGTLVVAVQVQAPSTGGTTPPAPITELPNAGQAGGPPSGAKVLTFGEPATDDQGEVAYLAEWRGGGVTPGSGIFTATQMVAKLHGTVAALDGATFTGFTNPLISNGSIGFRASLAGVPVAERSAILVGDPAAPEVLAQTGTVAPGADGQPLDGHPTFRRLAGFAVNGSTAVFEAVIGGHGVTAANDTGLWLKDAQHPPTLVLRTNQKIGGLTVRRFVSFATGDGSPGQGHGWLNGDHALALVYFAGGSQAVVSAQIGADPTILSQTGVAGTAVGPAAGTFVSYGVPSVTATGKVAFKANVALTAREKKVGTYANLDGAGFANIVQVGASASEGTTFSVLKDPVLAGDGGLAFPATIKGKGVKGNEVHTLWWRPAAGPLQLLAQGGDQATAEGAAWATFPSLAIAANRGPIFEATLVHGKGGVNATNDRGVWAVDSTGGVSLLFRTGVKDAIITGKTVKSFQVLSTAAGSAGLTRTFNDQQQVVWSAKFTDGTEAVITTPVP